MNWMATWIESGALCLIFTIMVYVLSAGERKVALAPLNYPPKIVERLIRLGKIKETKPLPLKRRLAKKLPALIIFLAGFVCLLYFVNGCRTFLSGFLTFFIIMFVWDWYDAFFLDCVLFCNTKYFIIEGTEDMVKEYHDYWFHIKGSLIGMILVVFGSLVIGGIIALLGLI